MTSIQILDPQVVDQIAAGEVVERPSHLVKELIENSLDAKSTRITVEIADGGRMIQIRDNGLGMNQVDLSKALDRFATSKIRASDDLWKLRTFGFRGEALASISAVSKLTLTSKTAEAEQAYQITSNFGQREKIEKAGREDGTHIRVESLFENIPARLKFLKSASAEITQIKTTIKALALAHPEVEWKVLVENQLVWFWPKAGSRLERCRQVLEIQNLYEGHAVRGDLQAHVVFADPNTTAKTSKNIWLFAQGRWIADRSVQAAVMEAYRQLLMHGEYPIAAVWIELPPDQIDVNIHPSKAQVKFLDPGQVFRVVAASLREPLEKAPWLQNLPLEKREATQAEQTFEPRAREESVQNARFEGPEFRQTFYQQKPTMEQWRVNATRPAFNEMTLGPATTEATANSRWQNLQILGQADLTYIVTQSDSGLMFVDQHAAHERVLFEKIMKGFANGNFDVQDFLFPLVLDLEPAVVEGLLGQTEKLAAMGVSIEQMGPASIGIRSAPHFLKEKALSEALVRLAHSLVEQGDSFEFEKSKGDVVATLACHSAVRAGQALSQEEMKSLLVSMDEFPLSSFCPHGRPVYVEYSFAKLEKDFGRTLS